MSEWLATDCHAHTRHSDGALTVAELVERTRALGVRPSVSDHISRDAPTVVDSPAAVIAYLDDLDGYPVLRGGEFCWHDSLWRELPPSTVRRFTHRLGSLHAVRLRDGSWLRAFGDLPEGLSPEEYMEAHVSSLEALAADMPVDILSHPTLIPPSMRTLDQTTLWTEALEERAVRALGAAGIAFELSARYVAHDRLVRRVVDAGVRISLGSDGHSREQVGNIAAPLARARALGIADTDLYDPERHGSRTGAFS